MLKWSTIFFVIAIIAAIFGFTGIAAGAASIAKVLFFIFLLLFLLTIIFGGSFLENNSLLTVALLKCGGILCYLAWLDKYRKLLLW